MEIKGEVFSINHGKVKKISKENLKGGRLRKGFGLEGDAHGGQGEKQVSILSIETIKKQTECPKAKKKGILFGPGDFAENITTKDLDLMQLNIGDRLRIGNRIILEVSAKGKKCHKFCAIYRKSGDCAIPYEGTFAKVLAGGKIFIGDKIIKKHENL